MRRDPAPVAVLVIYAVVLAAVTAPTPLWGSYQGRWDLTDAEVTSLYALYPVGVLLVLPWAGSWVDSWGRRRALAAGVAASAMSSSCLLLAGSPAWVAPARLLTGVASGLVVNAGNALLVDLRSTGERAGSVTATTANQLSLGLGAVVATAVVAAGSADATALFAGHLVLLVCVLPLLALVPAAQRAGVPRQQHAPGPLLPPGVFAPAALAAFASFAMCGLPAALAPTLAHDLLRTSGTVAGGLAVGVVFMGSGLSQLGWVRIRDEVAGWASGALAVVALAVVTAGLGASCAPLAGAGVLLIGPAVGGLFMASLSVVNLHADPAHRGRVATRYFSAAFAGLVVPVVLTGLLADTIGRLSAVVAFDALVLVCLATAARAIRRHQNLG